MNYYTWKSNYYADSWQGEIHVFIPYRTNITVIAVQEDCETTYEREICSMYQHLRKYFAK
jgi:hypothetical protein